MEHKEELSWTALTAGVEETSMLSYCLIKFSPEISVGMGEVVPHNCCSVGGLLQEHTGDIHQVLLVYLRVTDEALDASLLCFRVGIVPSFS